MFTNIIPLSDQLKKYITCFTVSHHGETFPLRYTAFPNLGTCLALFNHTSISIQPNKVTFTRDETHGPEIIVLGRLIQPTLITFNDPIDEIGINFTPCGINFFFEMPFVEIAGQSHQLLSESKWSKFASQLFEIPFKKRIESLEEFLLLNLSVHKDDPLQRINNITSEVNKLTVKELAEAACMSERNFLRYFKKYVGCSPSLFKKIIRFRNVLDAQYSKNTNAYHKFLITEDYYDSSHFRKEFLQFTGCALRSFKKGSFLPGNGSSVFKLM